jgi:3-hydroxyisobutyrate dehydrogenase-like beta-hydroxyacid dehydrogenase
MVADAGAVLFAMDGEHGALPVMRGESVWLQMGTVGEEAVERCARLAADRGIAFVDAPVLGTRQPSAEGELVILAAGPEYLAERLKPVFDVIRQQTMWVGAVGAGTRLKLVTNSWILAVVEAGLAASPAERQVPAGSRRSISRAMSSRADSAPTMAPMTEAQAASGGSAVIARHSRARPSSSGNSRRSTRPSV